jgi:predicted kinase
MNESKQSKPILWILVGLPGTGKTSWRQRRVEQAQGPVGIISSDDLIENAARGAGLSYNEMFALIHFPSLRSQLMLKFDDMINRKIEIIVDRMNLSRQSRANFLKRARGYHRVAVICDAPVEHIVAVNRSRKAIGRDIPEHVFANGLREYEEPRRDEGFHRILRYTPLGLGPLTTTPRRPPYEPIEF